MLVRCTDWKQFSTAPISTFGICILVDPSQSRAYGASMGRQLSDADLVGVFVLSDGLNVNGSELVRGLLSELGSAVTVSGGLAGDGARFAQTRVGADALPQPLIIAAIGFYGNELTRALQP